MEELPTHYRPKIAYESDSGDLTDWIACITEGLESGLLSQSTFVAMSGWLDILKERKLLYDAKKMVLYGQDDNDRNWKMIQDYLNRPRNLPGETNPNPGSDQDSTDNDAQIDCMK